MPATEAVTPVPEAVTPAPEAVTPAPEVVTDVPPPPSEPAIVEEEAPTAPPVDPADAAMGAAQGDSIDTANEPPPADDAGDTPAEDEPK